MTRAREGAVGNAARAAAGGIILLLAAGCGGDPPGDAWGGRVDTLPDGRVAVESPADGLWAAGNRWTARLDLRIGKALGDEPYLFGDVRGIAVDGLGRVWVLDNQANEIRVFSPDGRFVRAVGKGGEGPGEFRSPTGLARGSGGRMWVVDPRNVRVSVFDTAGRPVAEHRREWRSRGYTWEGGFYGSGFLLDRVVSTEEADVLVRRDSTFAPLDTLLVPRPDRELSFFRVEYDRGSMMQKIPFSPWFDWAVGPEGDPWSAPGAPYEIHRLRGAGDTLLTVRREWRPPPVTAEERSAAVERLRERFGEGVRQVDLSRVPETKPAVSTVFFDTTGHLWAGVHVSGEPPGRHFDVFDPEGRYLGRLTLPVRLRRRPKPVVTGDWIYGVHENEALGVHQVVRLALNRGGH